MFTKTLQMLKEKHNVKVKKGFTYHLFFNNNKMNTKLIYIGVHIFKKMKRFCFKQNLNLKWKFTKQNVLWFVLIILFIKTYT